MQQDKDILMEIQVVKDQLWCPQCFQLAQIGDHDHVSANRESYKELRPHDLNYISVIYVFHSLTHCSFLCEFHDTIPTVS